MKKLTKILIMLTLLSLMMFSCDDADTDHALVGSWSFTETDEEYGTIYSSNLTFTSSNITITDTGVCDLENEYYLDCEDWSCSSTGTWSENGDELTISFPVIDDSEYDSFDCGSGEYEVTYNIDGNTLTLTISHSHDSYEDYQMTLIYTRD